MGNSHTCCYTLDISLNRREGCRSQKRVYTEQSRDRHRLITNVMNMMHKKWKSQL